MVFNKSHIFLILCLFLGSKINAREPDTEAKIKSAVNSAIVRFQTSVDEHPNYEGVNEAFRKLIDVVSANNAECWKFLFENEDFFKKLVINHNLMIHTLRSIAKLCSECDKSDPKLLYLMIMLNTILIRYKETHPNIKYIDHRIGSVIGSIQKGNIENFAYYVPILISPDATSDGHTLEQIVDSELKDTKSKERAKSSLELRQKINNLNGIKSYLDIVLRAYGMKKDDIQPYR